MTGGAGFIGSNFIRTVLNTRPDSEIVCLDVLSYAGNLQNLQGPLFDSSCQKRFRFIKGSIDIRSDIDRAIAAIGKPDALINFAAESHVDRSIDSAAEFVDTNVGGTLALLERARKYGVEKFLQVSTDEVYGSLGSAGSFHENLPLKPNNPYSATKAAADMMVLAFAHTYGMKVLITRSSNNYGPRQFPEKLIPVIITNALENRPIPVYGDGKQVRDWLHVADNCRGILGVLENGVAGEVYNLGGGNEVENLDLVKTILDILGKPHSLIKHVTDRLGHDRRYAINCEKVSPFWKPSIPFKDGIKETVEWYQVNKRWLENIKSGAYRHFADHISY